MALFDMSDFMGNDGVNLLRGQKVQQGARYQNIAEPLHQSHDAGCNDPAFKNRPVQNIPVSQIDGPAEVFDAGALQTLFKGLTTPKFLDQQGADNGDHDQEDHKIDNFALGGGEKAFRSFKGQNMDDVGKP